MTIYRCTKCYRTYTVMKEAMCHEHGLECNMEILGTGIMVGH